MREILWAALCPIVAILVLFFFRFRQAVSTTGGRRRMGNLLVIARHSPKVTSSYIDFRIVVSHYLNASEVKLEVKRSEADMNAK